MRDLNRRSKHANDSRTAARVWQAQRASPLATTPCSGPMSSVCGSSVRPSWRLHGSLRGAAQLCSWAPAARTARSRGTSALGGPSVRHVVSALPACTETIRSA